MMGTNPAEPLRQAPAGDALSGELSRAAQGQAAAIPVLRHLLMSEAPTLLNEVVVARVRGMVSDLAGQLCTGARLPAPAPASGPASEAMAAIEARLIADEALLGHLHALALESHLAERFEQRISLDPVLAPLLQELIASDDPVVAELAMGVLAAQTRFMQSQRRMELPLHELPADLLGQALKSAEGLTLAGAQAALARMSAAYDEAATRLALLARLIAAMRRAVVATLACDRAGLALFASGLAAETGQSRRECVLACHEAHGAALALMLRAAGLDTSGIERQVMLIGALSPGAREAALLPGNAARAKLSGGAD
jgi:hypothetical protein